MTNSNFYFLEKLKDYIASNLNNTQFGVEELANTMSMSRSNLHRKLKKANGKSVSSFIREYRLEQAKQILSEGKMNVSEVSYTVGFNSTSYFNRSFSKYFGYPPKKTPLKANQIKEDMSIIVLPFKNLSLNKENQYLAEGMVEAISRHLSGINNLKVISNSAPNNIKSIEEIATKLSVTHLIKGVLQRHNNTIRIEIKIFETIKGIQIWAHSFDKTVFDILKIQNEIATKVAKVLDSKISKEEQFKITKRTSYKGEAYDNYLKGMFHMNHFEENRINRALTYFEKAISIDSSIAPAYTAIAVFYHMKASAFSATINSIKAFSKAEYYLNIALKLDKDWYFSYTIKAFQLTFANWNFKEADKNYKIGLNESKPLSHFMYRDFLQFENRHEEALKIALCIEKETPFYPNSSLIMSYYYNGMYKQGEAFINERLASFPTHHLVYDNAGFFMLNTGNYDKAITLFKQLIHKENKRLPRILSWMGAAYAKKGDTKKAIILLEELKNLKSKSDVGSPAFFTAIIYSALNKKEAALKWLKMSIDNHEMEVPWLVSEPQLYPLHGHPKFNNLVKQVGFRSLAYPVKLSKSPL